MATEKAPSEPAEAREWWIAECWGEAFKDKKSAEKFTEKPHEHSGLVHVREILEGEITLTRAEFLEAVRKASMSEGHEHDVSEHKLERLLFGDALPEGSEVPK